MPASRYPAAILFDAGGTLVIQDPIEMGHRLGTRIDPSAAHRAHYVAMAEYSDLRRAGDEADWDWWLSRYFTLLEVSDPESAGERIQRGYGLWNHALEGVRDTLERLLAAGVRTGVVSNSDGSVRASLQRAGLIDLFEFVIDSHEVGVAKPHPAIFEAALAEMGLEATEVWYVGDSLFHDVEGALAAGLGDALLVDPYRLAPEGVVTVESVAGL